MLRRNILIFHAGALGDFVLTWPLALALGRLYPQSRIYYITHAAKGALAERLLGVESADIEAGWHQLFADQPRLPVGPARLLAGAHAVFSFIARPGEPAAANLRTLAPEAQLQLLHPRPPQDHPAHAGDYIVDQLAAAPSIHQAARAMLRSLAESGLRRAAAAPGQWVIHPGSGSASKCWSAQGFARVARELAARGQRVRILLGEVERERWPAEHVRLMEEAAEVRCPATYLQLAEELSAASRYLGNDSGPSHLAGIMGLDCHVIFGPTDPAVWHPLGPRIKTMRPQALEALDARIVYDWLLRP